MKHVMENRLYDILDEKGIEILDLAAKAKVHRNTITNACNGTIPRLDIAHKIAKALNKSIYDIWKLD